MTTPQMRRIQTLEDHRGGTEVTKMLQYVAETNGTTIAGVIAEAETIMATSPGLTEAERNERLARELGRTVAQIESDLAEIREDFSRWKQERSA